MWKRVLLLAALLAPSVACFEIQGTHTLYLSPDGSVVWTVLEEGIRFDASTREEKRRREKDFLDRVVSNEHETAVALEALYPGSLTARVLREDSPPAILTEAHFPGIDLLYRNLFGLYGVPGSAELEVGEDRARLDVRFWTTEEDEAANDPPGDPRDEILLALLLECRIVLTEGKFVEAEGFEIVDGGRAVRPLPLDTPPTLSLSWTMGAE